MQIGESNSRISIDSDHSGHEVDLLIEDASKIRAVEIKSAETLNPELFDGLRWFCRQTGLSPADCALVYGGSESQTRSAGRVIPWNQAHLI